MKATAVGKGGKSEHTNSYYIVILNSSFTKICYVGSKILSYQIL